MSDDSHKSPTESILERMGRGSETAWRELLDRYGASVRRALRAEANRVQGRAMRARIDSELDEMFNDVIVELHHDHANFDYRPGKLEAFLATIARNKVRDRIDFWNAEKRKLGLEQPHPPPGETSREEPLRWGRRGPATSAAGREEQRQAHQRILDCAQVLDEKFPDDRFGTLIKGRFLDGKPWKEIGAELGKSPDAARMELNKLLALANQLLDRDRD